jgi:hypothetical protein
VKYDLLLLHDEGGSRQKCVKRNTKIGAGAKRNDQLHHKPLDLQEITSLLIVLQHFFVNYDAGSFIQAGIFY